MRKLILLMALFCGIGWSQIPPNTAYVYAYIGTATPALCNNRDLFYNVITYQWLTCGPVNNWAAFGNTVTGATIAATTNFISGSGTGNGVNSGVPVSGAGIVGLFSGGANGYLGTDAARHALPTVPTVASTTNALVGDGAGNVNAASGTATNCLQVNGSSKACGGAGFFTTVSSGALAVSAATHGQGIAAIPACYDNTTPNRVPVSCNYTEDDSGNFNFTFASAGALRIK